MSIECGSRSAYLVTYSQVDKSKCESKEVFARMVGEEFKDCSVERWASCEEPHEETGGSHYHLALKLDRVKRWKAVRQRLEAKYQFCVNFSDHHSNYYSAFQYVCKQDKNIAQSIEHPVYVGSPKTSKASKFRKSTGGVEDASASGPSTSKKSRRIDIVDVYDQVVKKGIKNDLHFCALAKAELEDGKRDFANFVLSKTEKSRNEILKTAWKINGSTKTLLREKQTLLELLEEASKSKCVCKDRWTRAAYDILNSNGICKLEFVFTIKNI